MAREDEPKVKAPWPPQRAGDSNYRWPDPYRVGRRHGESLASIARRFGLTAADLLEYNFRTTREYEVNWYLLNYVKCRKPKRNQRYYALSGAKYVEGGTSGVIYIPRWGEPTTDPANRLGEQVVKDYNASQLKKPGGLCYVACHARVAAAVRRGGGTPLDPLSPTTTFGRLWGSINKPLDSWLEIDESYRGKGAAGAMAWADLGTLVDESEIWRGALLPGAVIQVWGSADTYEKVRDGEAADIGHSFIHLNYVYEGGAIIGMAVADQSYYGVDELATRTGWGWWVGANLSTALEP